MRNRLIACFITTLVLSKARLSATHDNPERGDVPG